MEAPPFPSTRPFPDAVAHVLGDHVLLFSPSTQKLLKLNASAAAIWARLVETGSRDACVRDLTAIEGLAVSVAARYVDTVSKDLERCHAVVEPEYDFDLPPAPPPPGFASAAESLYRLGPLTVLVACANGDDHELIAGALAHLRIANAPADHVIQVPSTVSGGHLVVDRTHGLPCASRDALVPTLTTILFSLWYRACCDFVAFHAGVVRFRGQTVLVAGESGSGKSSVTAALLALGGEYLSDDVVALERRTFAARGFPFPVTLKRENVPNLVRPFPELAIQAEHRRTDGTALRYLIPPRLAREGGETGRSEPIRWLVYPRYEPGARPAVTVVEPADALERLSREWVRARNLTASEVGQIVDWIATTEAFELTFGSVDDVIRDLGTTWPPSAKASPPA